MHKRFLIAGSVFAGLGVALGAFGAHGLQNLTQDEKIVHGFQTAVQYQVYHAFALLAAGIIFEKFRNRLVRWAGNCFITGIILFSGSLYLITFLKIQESDAVKFAGPITPTGGLFFMAGWLLLLLSLIKKR